ncbi:MAG: penicillin-binding protein 2 [Spirochaetota bacterium]
MKKYYTSVSEYKLERSFRVRLYVFTVIIVLVLFVFIAQLFNLQLIHGSENSLKANNFVLRNVELPATRGFVFDRNFISPEVSRPLISNSDTFDVHLIPRAFRSKKKDILAFIKYFCKVLAVPKDRYKKIIAEPKFSKAVKSRKSIILLRDISKKQHERIVGFFFDYEKKIKLIPSPKRIYHLGGALAHISGYVGKPSDRDLKSDRGIKRYHLIGKNGIEKQYDQFLRGSDGFRIQKKNSIGLVEEEKVIEEAKMGNNLVLTIDRNIQLAAYKSLYRYRGTVIALRPSTGEVLAMVSSPSFDPNILSGHNRKIRQKHLRKIRRYKAFLNLAIQSRFPPASTYKSLVALAALESEHRITYEPSQTYMCDGKFRLKSTRVGVADQTFKCWEKHGHGRLNLTQAIEKSCSVYFYNLGYKLGAEPILTYSRLFRLNKKSFIDLPGEIEGLVPDGNWKRRIYRQKWYDGDTVNLSIGQGFITVTPIGITLFYMALLNRGKIYQPYILSEIRDPVTNAVIHKTKPKINGDIPLKRSTILAVLKGLRAVGKTGTASSVFNVPGLPKVAGKTGTAQTRRRGSSSSNHAWFIGYAPYGAAPESQVLVTVFVEYGVGGSVGAAPIAREVFRAAFPPGSYARNKPIRKDLELEKRKDDL